jgi:type II secretory pathway component PulK
MRRKANSQRGVILVICLWLLGALSLLVLGLAYRLLLEGKIMRYRLRREEMLELARAAVTLETVRIAGADPVVTYYGQAWARPVILNENHMSDLAAQDLKRYRVEAVVIDELSKLNVNGAVRRQLTSVHLVDEELAGAVIDWRDSDGVKSELGAENEYYSGLQPPIICKNAPLESIQELLCLRGVTPALFYGRSSGAIIVENDPTWQYRPMGLRDYLTCRGNGTVNLNTAPSEVLLAIPGLEPMMVDYIVHRRLGSDGLERTDDDRPFVSFDELRLVGGMTEFAVRQLAMHCTLKSDFFCIRAWVTDRTSSGRLALDVDVERTQQGMQVLYWGER